CRNSDGPCRTGIQGRSNISADPATVGNGAANCCSSGQYGAGYKRSIRLAEILRVGKEISEMRYLDRDPKVMQLACELRIADWQNQPVEKIIDYCSKKIAGWIKPFKTATDIDAIQRIVCAKLGLVFEEFRTDEELENIIQKYI